MEHTLDHHHSKGKGELHDMATDGNGATTTNAQEFPLRRRSKPPLKPDEPGEGSGSRTPPPGDEDAEVVGGGSVRYISDLDGGDSRGVVDEGGKERKRGGGLRERFREWGRRLRLICGRREGRRRRKGVDKGKGRMVATEGEGDQEGDGVVVVVVGGREEEGEEEEEEEEEEGMYNTLPRPLSSNPVSGLGETHPVLRPGVPGEGVDFFDNPPPNTQDQQLATVREVMGSGPRRFAPAPVVMTTTTTPALPRLHDPSSSISQHGGFDHHRQQHQHQPVIIHSPHPIADTYTHEEDWARVHQAKASQHLAPRPLLSQHQQQTIMIPERHSSKWRARSFYSGSFRTRSQCGSFDSRMSWNPFDLPGPPKRTLMSDMESLLGGRGGGIGWRRSQGSSSMGQRQGGSSFPWPPTNSVKTGRSSTIEQPDSAVGGVGLRGDDEDGFMRGDAANKTVVSSHTPTPMSVPSPPTVTKTTLGRDPSRKTDGSNTGMTSWSGTGSETVNDTVLGGLGEQRRKSGGAGRRDEDEEEVERTGVKDGAETSTGEAGVEGRRLGRGGKVC
ncbi:hypothetical protein QC762_110175 [Podospora pseudocomata]|uniref:Uncharacterized protein n=1 Tax=Podospora pseudocomata TaxID=2093779 RepID=A0ABR0GUJ3_9PEZI|nr:hypothetical protein QC762_110175 [Podospora pseudocomata]